MTLAVKENELPDPVKLSLFGANAVVVRADEVTHLLKQFWHGEARYGLFESRRAVSAHAVRFCVRVRRTIRLQLSCYNTKASTFWKFCTSAGFML